jgi:tRNA(Ile)-lysidine synthase
MRPRKSSSVPERSESASAAEVSSPLLQEEFSQLLEALGPFEPQPLLACAVSGGADSLALLYLTTGWASARGGTVVALTVDHGLRPEAAAEARRVAELAQELGALHRTLVWEDPPVSGAVQEAARAARLRLLTTACRELNCLHLLLAHQQDDQFETFLLRLSQKSDLDGLASMSSQRRYGSIRLLRPLLTISKARLKATLRSVGTPWIEDPSNRDPRHMRVRLRRMIAQGALPEVALKRAADSFTRLRRFTEQQLSDLLADSVTFCPGGYAQIDAKSLKEMPEPLALRLLARVLQSIGGGNYPPRSRSLQRLLSQLRDPEMKKSTLGNCQLIAGRKGWLVVRETGKSELLPIRPGETRGWQTFRLSLCSEGLEGCDPAGFTIGALGQADRRHLRSVDGETRDTGVPGPARAALPALRYLDAVVAVPHLKQYQWGFDRALRVSAAESNLSATRLDFTLLTCVGILPREPCSS